MAMTNHGASMARLHQRAAHELKEFAIIAAYLYVCILSVLLLKAAVLHGQGISYAPIGFAVIKAMIFAKFMLIGHGLKIGGKHASRPLIWPTMSKAFAFLALVIVLELIEQVLVGALHGKSVASSLADLAGPNLPETLANIFILFLILIPYCAFRALGETLGDGNLAKLFFVERGTLTYCAAAPPKAPPEMSPQQDRS